MFINQLPIANVASRIYGARKSRENRHTVYTVREVRVIVQSPRHKVQRRVVFG